MKHAFRRRRAQLELIFSPRARRGFALATAGSIAIAILEAGSILMVAPLLQVLMGGSYDEGAIGVFASLLGLGDRDAVLLTLLGLVVAGFVVKDVFTLVFRWWMTGFLNRERAETYVSLLRFYLNAPHALTLERSTSKMLRMIGDSTGQVFALVARGLMGIVIDGATVLVIGIALIVATPVYSLGLLVFFTIVSTLLFRRVRTIASREGRRQLELAELGYKTALHSLGGAKEIKLRHTQHHFLDIYRDIELRSAHTQRLIAFLAELPKHVLEIAFFLAFFALTFVVLSTSSAESLLVSIGLLGAGAFRLLPALSRVVAATAGVRAGLPALDDVAEDLAAERHQPAPQPPAESPMPYEHSITIEDVHFRYRPDLPDVLHGIDLTVPRGSSIAFVGTSGAGKSTLVDTVLGLHTPTAGRIRVDGEDISDHMAAWHANIAVVPQEVFLLDASVRENIAFDRSPTEIDDDLVRDCLERAQLTDVIDALPEGLGSMVGERGTRLSGGQRQRLGIARALYRRPRLLVLDEATSALDNETERRITETIASLHGQVTVIVVAHRLSTIRDLDAVAFMADGRIESLGTFSQVRQDNAAFAALVELARMDR